MASWTTSPLRHWVSAAVLAVVLADPALCGEISSARQAQLRNLVLQDCGSCHGMTMKGGLGSSLLPSDLADFDETSIAQIVLDGVPGTPMPPWRGLLSQTEAEWIANALKAGVLK